MTVENSGGDDSLFSALADILRSQSYRVYTAAELHALIVQHSTPTTYKALPAGDWSFMQDVIRFATLTRNCVRLIGAGGLARMVVPSQYSEQPRDALFLPVVTIVYFNGHFEAAIPIMFDKSSVSDRTLL